MVLADKFLLPMAGFEPMMFVPQDHHPPLYATLRGIVAGGPITFGTKNYSGSRGVSSDPFKDPAWLWAALQNGKLKSKLEKKIKLKLMWNLIRVQTSRLSLSLLLLFSMASVSGFMLSVEIILSSPEIILSSSLPLHKGGNTTETKQRNWVQPLKNMAGAKSWGHYDMETLSVLLALCVGNLGNSPNTGPTIRPWLFICH